jgi:hypothetical protein
VLVLVPVLVPADFVADDAANGRAADGSDGAAARKNGTSDGTDSRADNGISVLCRHAGTATQTEQERGGQ